MGSVSVQTPVEVSSSDRVEPGSFPLKIAQYPTSATIKSTDPSLIATRWVRHFNEVICSGDFTGIPDLFLSESYWRDQLCLSWDFHCFNGVDKIVTHLKQSKIGCRIKSLKVDSSSALRAPTATVLNADGTVHVVQTFLTVGTDVGDGEGIVRLVQDDGGKWKAFTLFTVLKNITDHHESIGKRRAFGVEHGEHASRKNWLDRRNAEKNFEDGQEPTVLILGE